MGIEKKQVKLTIGIPVYNGEKFLEEKITSILNQDFINFELIISDNGSTDSTKEICNSFAIKDERIRFFSHKNNATIKERNKTISFLPSASISEIGYNKKIGA